MPIQVEKLDNPVWFSLAETHQPFSISFNGAKFYHPDYCPFGGYNESGEISKAIDEYATICDNFFVVGEKPVFSSILHLKNELICDQMIVADKIDVTFHERIIKLTDNHADELYMLVNLVQPGYFKSKTRLLGNYYGIFKDDQLVAVTGERMGMHGFTEISAVVTHPDFTGRGYAKQLVAHTANEIINQNNTPFLHVTETNSAAIKLYQALGFITRRKISFWHFVK